MYTQRQAGAGYTLWFPTKTAGREITVGFGELGAAPFLTPPFSLMVGGQVFTQSISEKGFWWPLMPWTSMKENANPTRWCDVD